MYVPDQIYLTSCLNKEDLAPIEKYEGEPKVFEPDDVNVSMQVKSNLSERVIFQSLLYNLQKLELF